MNAMASPDGEKRICVMLPGDGFYKVLPSGYCSRLWPLTDWTAASSPPFGDQSAATTASRELTRRAARERRARERSLDQTEALRIDCHGHLPFRGQGEESGRRQLQRPGLGCLWAESRTARWALKAEAVAVHDLSDRRARSGLPAPRRGGPGAGRNSGALFAANHGAAAECRDYHDRWLPPSPRRDIPIAGAPAVLPERLLWKTPTPRRARSRDWRRGGTAHLLDPFSRQRATMRLMAGGRS